LAAEFCKLVGAPNLLAYLGLPDDGVVTDDLAADAVARLKARRKFMQGMQGNPKYKREALFLIRHFSTLNNALGDVRAYLQDARQREESEHLPVVEMTVRGVLAGGGVTDDQIAYLRRNAEELGVSDETFRDLLTRVAAELDVTLDLGAPGPGPGAAPGEVPLDLYQLLDVAPTATDADVRMAYHRRLDRLDDIADPDARESMRRRIEIARKVLLNDAARSHYDLTSARTGPPARNREYGPTNQTPTAPPFRAQGAPTAPPARDRWSDPGIGPRLEILGDPVRAIWLGRGIAVVQVVIRNGGQGAMAGAASADVPWLAVDPTRLDPEAVEQTLSVQVDPGDVPEGASTAVVTIETERGERARVVFEVRRRSAPSLALAVGGAVLLVGFLLLAALVWAG
ncbi:MAG: hypothetical protein R3F59_35430, partial [Myxococcota bacterium]